MTTTKTKDTKSEDRLPLEAEHWRQRRFGKSPEKRRDSAMAHIVIHATFSPSSTVAGRGPSHLLRWGHHHYWWELHTSILLTARHERSFQQQLLSQQEGEKVMEAEPSVRLGEGGEWAESNLRFGPSTSSTVSGRCLLAVSGSKRVRAEPSRGHRPQSTMGASGLTPRRKCSMGARTPPIRAHMEPMPIPFCLRSKRCREWDE